MVAVDVPAMLSRLNDWAAAISLATRRMWTYRAHESYRDVSENQFRIMAMLTTLQRELHVTYRSELIDAAYDARDSRSCFIHGPLGSFGGTCANLPFLYAALGRRLGYPLYIVQAKEHLFIRWDRGSERFNIETTARGFVSHEDSHYRLYPQPIPDCDLKQQPIFLRNMTHNEEVACCLMERSRVLFDNLHFRDAERVAHAASQLSSYYLGAWQATRCAFEIVMRGTGLGVLKSADQLRPAITFADGRCHSWVAINARTNLLRVEALWGGPRP